MTITSEEAKAPKFFSHLIMSPPCSTASPPGRPRARSPATRDPVPSRRRVYVTTRVPTAGRRAAQEDLGLRQGSPLQCWSPQLPQSAETQPLLRKPTRGRGQRESARTPARRPLTCSGSAPGPRRRQRAARTSRPRGECGKLRGRGWPGARATLAPAATTAASGASWAAVEPSGPHE